jgi:hypothetical protein
MKKTQEPKSHKISDEIAEEYQFDYRMARPNRFAKAMEGSPLVVVLDKDVAEVFNREKTGRDPAAAGAVQGVTGGRAGRITRPGGS